MDERHRSSSGRGSFARRLLARMRATDTEHSARAVVAELVARPPGDLAALERLVGRLDVDMAGPEGLGAGVFRPDSPFDADGGSPAARRGQLRPGIVRLFAGFEFDMYHGQPRTAGALRPNQLSVSMDLDRAEVQAIVEHALGAPRAIERGGSAVLEFGTWYYLEPGAQPATLAWHRTRPDWALPPVSADAPRAFLLSLAAVLASPAPTAVELAALTPLGAAAGAAVDLSERRVSVSARPGLPLPAVAGALGWDEPVAWSTDVHMSHWTVGQRDPVTGGPGRTTIGRWRVETWLASAPREAPRIAAPGPSPAYDLRGHPGLVAGLLATVDDETA